MKVKAQESIDFDRKTFDKKTGNDAKGLSWGYFGEELQGNTGPGNYTELLLTEEVNSNGGIVISEKRKFD